MEKFTLTTRPPVYEKQSLIIDNQPMTQQLKQAQIKVVKSLSSVSTEQVDSSTN